MSCPSFLTSCAECCVDCCCPQARWKKKNHFPNIEYKTPKHANETMATTAMSLEKVPPDKIFEFQQPRTEYSMHPQIGGSPSLSPSHSHSLRPLVAAHTEQPKPAHYLLPHPSPSHHHHQHQPALPRQEVHAKQRMKLTRTPSVSSMSDSETPQPYGSDVGGVGAGKISDDPSLQFSLYYDMQRGVLTVHLLHLLNLFSLSSYGNGGVFVEVFLIPNKEVMCESKVVEGGEVGGDARFDQEFDFKGLLPNEIRAQTLVMRVYNYNKMLRNSLIGVVYHPLQDADLYGTTVICKIEDRAENLKADSGGDILLSLSYQTHPHMALTGIVLKARNLSNKGEGLKNIDPFVKVTMVYRGDRQHVEKWKSTIKKNTNTPIFNESFHFDLSNTDIDHVSLEVLVLSHDHFSRSTILGVVTIGSASSDPMGKAHWNEMLASPSQPVSRWHAIIPSRALTHSNTV